ncbi:MAG: ATP-binding cassette domain-containing protein [Archaeoglobaceae archaeon]|nr:ATP-binding cassette domain-containing protein [Archaeoglobaceae archaeon]MCX8152428.1 ATP-binding cassette domain-containing protein [Archaeoglobaceae archaeon]MDW8013768.1 ATP-binding cassette domain-containing protein [Archaeoglobaceae archaeon]
MPATLGPNESGKTTLLRTIFGILKPKSSAVLFDGKKLSVEGAAKVAAYLPQGIPESKLK